MNSVPCPGCGLPREADLIGRVPCPVCADVGGEQTGDSRPPLAQEPHDPTRGLPADVSELTRSIKPPKRIPVAPLLFAVGIAVGVLVVLGWQAFDAARQSVGESSLASGGRKPPVDSAGSPVDSPTDSTNPTALAKKPEPLAVAPMPHLYVAVAPMPHVPVRAPDPRVTQVDLPNATYTPQVKPGQTVTLKGRVKTLRVPALEGGAVLDTTELEAESVVVFGRITASQLRVRVAKGRVEFRSMIDAGSVVQVTARTTVFVGKIVGPETRVAVTVTRGGTLGFAAIDGLARLEYRTDNPAADDPLKSKGNVVGAATVVRVD